MNRVVEVARRVGQRYRRLAPDAIMQLTPAFCGS
jgi:hypothetical protein